MLKFLFFFFAFVVLSTGNVFADIGCLVGNTLYTNLTGGCTRCFDNTPGDIFITCGWTRVGTTNTCRVYLGSGSLTNTANYTLYNTAYSSNWQRITSCPLDKYLPILIFPIVGFAYRRMRAQLCL